MGLIELSRAECLAALGQARIGRVGISSHALPAIVPVNYTLIGDQVVFGVTEGSALAAATRQAIVAFQAEAYDSCARTGWSVHILGPASWITDIDELATAQCRLTESWVNGRGPQRAVRIEPVLVTGHRIEADHRSRPSEQPAMGSRQAR